jgi:hypothetical protein
MKASFRRTTEISYQKLPPAGGARSDGEGGFEVTQICTGCDIERDLINIERLGTPRYTLRIFRCSSCGSLLRLVVPRSKPGDGHDALLRSEVKIDGSAAKEEASPSEG